MESTMLLDTYLKQLQLTTFLRNYHKFAEDAASANLNYDRYLLALAEQEIAQRERNRQLRLMKEARLPVKKELADFDFTLLPQLNKAQVLELTKGHYIRKAEPILLIGNPGLGKTHLAIALSLLACRQGHKVRFFNAAGLVNELIQAQDQHSLTRFIKAAAQYQVVVLDELGFIPFSVTGAQLIFQFCSALYEKVALIITTNLHFADWNQVFGDERLTAALLDRLTHRAHILEFVGESYRFRQRLQVSSGLTPLSPPDISSHKGGLTTT
jgi:DNA replication protein DnaC